MMCSSARLSEACACQRPVTKREREKESHCCGGCRLLHQEPLLWPSIHTVAPVQQLSACAAPVEHSPPGNNLGLAEEEEMNLFQYSTPISIKSEVSDPEKTKLAEMTF